MKKCEALVRRKILQMKKCEACGKTLGEEFFEVLDKKYFRNICRNCSNAERNKSRSKTPEAYIRHLYSQLKYSRKKKNPEMFLVFPVFVHFPELAFYFPES